MIKIERLIYHLCRALGHAWVYDGGPYDDSERCERCNFSPDFESDGEAWDYIDPDDIEV